MKVIEITSQIILILPQASVEDAYSPPIDRSTAMIFRVFSSLLDENTAWFALNERLCGKPPRRFQESQMFSVFPNEIKRVKMDELRDANGDRPSIEWFNSGSKYHKNRLEYVFVGSTFAVFAGNLSRKDLNTEGDFFKTDAFILLKNGINRQDLSLLSTLGFQIGMDIVQGSEGSDIGSSFCVKVSEESFDSSFVNEESHSSVESPRTSESPPKCSTPKAKKNPPPLSFTNDSSSTSSSCDSSTTSISSSSYAPATKKRKIREKVDTVMSSVENLINDQGETLGDLIAQSCLFKRQKKFQGTQMIADVFSKVADEIGVKKTFSELVPDELWDKRVELMAVPDWQLLLCKLEARISDDGWQMLLNRTQLGKSGVSFWLYFIDYQNN